MAEPGSGSPQPAERSDAEPLLALREAAAAWLAGRGGAGRGQWEPGEVTLDQVLGQFDAGEWYVLRDDGPVAGLRLLWQDEQVWGAQPPVAAYVHGLVVAAPRRGPASARRCCDGPLTGPGDGPCSGSTAARATALGRYYAQQGFRPVGRRDADGRRHCVVLLERPHGEEP